MWVQHSQVNITCFFFLFVYLDLYLQVSADLYLLIKTKDLNSSLKKDLYIVVGEGPGFKLVFSLGDSRMPNCGHFL